MAGRPKKKVEDAEVQEQTVEVQVEQVQPEEETGVVEVEEALKQVVETGIVDTDTVRVDRQTLEQLIEMAWATYRRSSNVEYRVKLKSLLDSITL